MDDSIINCSQYARGLTNGLYLPWTWNVNRLLHMEWRAIWRYTYAACNTRAARDVTTAISSCVELVLLKITTSADIKNIRSSSCTPHKYACDP